MLKMIFLCRRRPDITREQYAERVLKGHAPLAIRHHPAMRRYVIHIAEGRIDGPEVDSLPSLYFDSLEDFRERLYDSPAGRAAIRADVQRFMGGAADAYATREQVHRDELPPAPPGERTPGLKLVCPLARRRGMTHDDFVAYWREIAASRLLERARGLDRYVTNAVEARVSPRGDDWDGFEELHFARAEDGRAWLAAQRAADPERAFVSRALRYPVGEYVQVR